MKNIVVPSIEPRTAKLYFSASGMFSHSGSHIEIVDRNSYDNTLAEMTTVFYTHYKLLVTVRVFTERVNSINIFIFFILSIFAVTALSFFR